MPIDGLPLMLESEKKAEPWLSHLSVSGEYPIIHHAADFVKTLGSLFFMMADQASGLPTAEHGLFHRCFSFFLFLFSLFFVPKSNSLNALSSCRFKIDALTVKGVVSSKKGLSVNSFGRLGSNSSFLFTNKQANNNGCSPFVFLSQATPGDLQISEQHPGTFSPIFLLLLAPEFASLCVNRPLHASIFGHHRRAAVDRDSPLVAGWSAARGR